MKSLRQQLVGAVKAAGRELLPPIFSLANYDALMGVLPFKVSGIAGEGGTSGNTGSPLGNDSVSRAGNACP